MKRLRAIAEGIGWINEKITNYFTWLLIFPITGLFIFEVILRYIFKSPTSWTYDMSWMVYSAFVFLAGGYTLKHDGHVRVDLLYTLISQRARAIINIICYLFLYFPVYISLCLVHFNMLIRAIKFGQTSPYTNWAPPMWPVLLFMLIGIVLITLQGVADLIRHIEAAQKGEYEI